MGERATVGECLGRVAERVDETGIPVALLLDAPHEFGEPRSRALQASLHLGDAPAAIRRSGVSGERSSKPVARRTRLTGFAMERLLEVFY